ncbi:hypothetical protein [Nocardia sp. alder85J]|uniref:hypothetical protein n=1 Tax=Nocardia sp. alder85J TaxID=2862949 RepID=UPI001CD49F6F|nr:hypothetical protein [Nocardia sp. alder85J]MCX4094999.1 hypothetical protein [Nocardia sp. alder85J]
MTPAPVSAPHRRRNRVGLLALAIAAAALGTTTHPFDRAAIVMVTVFAVAALVRALLTPDRPRRLDARMVRGLALWIGLATALLAWELFTWSHQPRWSVPDPAHPTFSTLLSPYLTHGPLRFAGWLTWLGLGWMLVRQ